jgi:hypothetical protein
MVYPSVRLGFLEGVIPDKRIRYLAEFSGLAILRPPRGFPRSNPALIRGLPLRWTLFFGGGHAWQYNQIPREIPGQTMS